jgi:hypothetical protein
MLYKKYKYNCKESFLDDRETQRELERDPLWAFLIAKPKPLWEVKMAIPSKGDRRKGMRRQSSRRKGDIEEIKIREERDKEQEVIVHHEAVPEKKASSVWSWHEEFTAEWSETFITKKRKTIQKDEKERREK